MSKNESTHAQILRSAAYSGDVQLVHRLILEGVDVNVWDEHGYTALTYAATQGHMDIVTLLLENGAWVEPHEDYDTYDTPLMVAVTHGHIDVVKKLIEAGADPTKHVGRSQATAEFYARDVGRRDIQDFLLQIQASRKPNNRQS